MRKNVLTGILVLIILLGGLIAIMQFRKVVNDPPVTETIPAPPEVLAILQRSCFDCHSNETRITWLQKLPVASSMVASDVEGARSILNFTEWNKYTPLEKDALIYLTVMAADQGRMPPEDFLVVHPQAKLSMADKGVLKKWLSSIRPQ